MVCSLGLSLTHRPQHWALSIPLALLSFLHSIHHHLRYYIQFITYGLSLPLECQLQEDEDVVMFIDKPSGLRTVIGI